MGGPRRIKLKQGEGQRGQGGRVGSEGGRGRCRTAESPSWPESESMCESVGLGREDGVQRTQQRGVEARLRLRRREGGCKGLHAGSVTEAYRVSFPSAHLLNLLDSCCPSEATMPDYPHNSKRCSGESKNSSFRRCPRSRSNEAKPVIPDV